MVTSGPIHILVLDVNVLGDITHVIGLAATRA